MTKEPIAWYYELAYAIDTETKEYCGWTANVALFEPKYVHAGSIRNVKALYEAE